MFELLVMFEVHDSYKVSTIHVHMILINSEIINYKIGRFNSGLLVNSPLI